MKNQRLQHDTAVALATTLLEIVENCIRPEELRDAFDAFYEACKGALECYESMKRSDSIRLRPSRN